MKTPQKIFLILSLFFITSFSYNSTVYLCDSSTSIAYHQVKSCRGLKACTHSIIAVSQTKAFNEYEKKPCKICY
jgi:hypothetical protein